MTIGAKYRERALDATAAAFDACIDEYEAALATCNGTIARQQQGIETLKAALRDCEAAHVPPVAIVEGDMPAAMALAEGVTWLGQVLGRALMPGETARLRVPAGQYAPLFMGGEGHSWWAKGTLEIASHGGPSAIVSPRPGVEAISIQSNVDTGGTGGLTLRDIALQGAVHISCLSGLSLRLLGQSFAASAARDAGPATPL